MNVKVESWQRIIRAMRRLTGNKDGSEIAILQAIGVCPYALISPLSWELFRLYQICDGFRRITHPSMYYRLPALYCSAVEVIEHERAKFTVKHERQ